VNEHNQGREHTGDYVNAGGVLLWMLVLVTAVFAVADLLWWLVGSP
jgi:hypothetical protein